MYTLIHRLSELWGTKEYFAPELINRAYGPQVIPILTLTCLPTCLYLPIPRLAQADLWSLGCIVFEMLCGEVAFPLRRGESDSAFYRRVTEGLVKYDR
jgi:serine/threonine protein kinase